MRVKLVAFLLCLILVCLCKFAIADHGYVTITVFNPYRFSVWAQVKCDWDHKKQAFKFIQEYTVPRKSNIKVRISKEYVNCELWPKVNL